MATIMRGKDPVVEEPSVSVAVPGFPGATGTLTEDIETMSPDDGINARLTMPENPLTEVTVTVVVVNSFG